MKFGTVHILKKTYEFYNSFIKLCKSKLFKGVHLYSVIIPLQIKFNKMRDSKNCIDACLACVITCENCITDCIKDGNQACILLCRDCADICALCARLEARGSQYAKDLCALCVKVCAACAEECSKHASHHESCKTCAEACKKCVEACA